jgi:osmotically-inducible protein OsmY
LVGEHPIAKPLRIGDSTRMNDRIVFSVAVITLGLVAGCSREEAPQYSSMVATNSSASASDTNHYSSNPALTNGVSSLEGQVVSTIGYTNVSFIEQQQQIHDSLMADASLALIADTVHVSKTSNGHLVLEGSVTTPTQKQQVNDIAEHIAGVGKVNNQLTIK